MHFILGQCVTLRNKNWQLDERSNEQHKHHASAMIVTIMVRMLNGNS